MLAEWLAGHADVRHNTKQHVEYQGNIPLIDGVENWF